MIFVETSIGGKEEDTLMVETGNGEKGKAVCRYLVIRKICNWNTFLVEDVDVVIQLTLNHD
ncbi:hypothetical protein QTP88_005118 [Uroleucon formosanum]